MKNIPSIGRRLLAFFGILPALLPCVTALAGTTSIPFTYEGRVPFVHVQTKDNNQAPMCFILDTGASTTVVGSTTADRLKLGAFKAPQPTNDLATATTCGLSNAPATYIQGLRATCSGLPLKPTAIRADITNIGLGGGRPADGLLGTDFLRNKILTIDCANRVLRIETVSGTENTFARMVDAVPADQHAAVFVKISTPASPRPLVFLVDTGTTHCILDLQTAQRLKLPLGAERAANVVGGKKSAYLASNFVGSFEGRPLPSQIFVVDLSQLSWSLARHIDGILGMNFMENYTVKINFHTLQMQLLPNRAACQDVVAR